MTEAGRRILQSVKQARAFVRNGQAEGFVAHVPDVIDVRAIRHKLQMSQAAFALRFGFSEGAIRDWEQGRRQPEQAARVLLMVIDHNPDAVDRALAEHMREDQR